jgi:ATP-dependent Clp protease ATP-binding subunit ClpA
MELDPATLPPRLRDCQIVSLPINAVVAGTPLRGMFEERIQHVIRELKARPNLILFVDEAHTLVGAGSALGAPSDAANMLKAVLARGEIRVIAATDAQRIQGTHRRGRSVRAPVQLRSRGGTVNRGDPGHPDAAAAADGA